MNALTPISTTAVANPLMPTDMNSAFRLADMMSKGKLVPNHLQGQPGDCLMVIEQAVRWGMSPFAVAQSTSVIQGKLMFEGKLVGAALQASGLLSDRMDYEFSGEGADRSVRAFATFRGEGKAREVTVALKDVKTTNNFWTKQPDQQLIYSANRVWARRHAPEVMLGIYAPEEFEAPPQQRDTFSGQTIDARAEPARPVPPRQSAASYLDDSIPSLDDEQPNQKSAADEKAEKNAAKIIETINRAPTPEALTDYLSKKSIADVRAGFADLYPQLMERVNSALDVKVAELSAAPDLPPLDDLMAGIAPNGVAP